MSDWLQIGADDGIDLKRIIGDRESSLDWKREKEYFIAWTHILTRTTVLVIAIANELGLPDQHLDRLRLSS